MLDAALSTLMLAPTPPAPGGAETAGLSLDFWSNLPLIACLSFTVVALIGILIIVRENRRVAQRIKSADADTPEES